MAKLLSNRLSAIKERPFSFALIFLSYLFLASVFSGFFNTLRLVTIYANTVSWEKLVFSLILTLIIAFLVSLNAVIILGKIKQRRVCRGQGTIAAAATIGGLIVGVCPICVTGLTTIILSALGVGFTFAILPFQGVEVQIIIILLLLLSLFIVDKKFK